MKKHDSIKAVLPLLLTLIVIVPIFSQENQVYLQIGTQLQPGRPGISVYFQTIHTQTIREVLNDGLESQIFFYIRLYRKAEGLFAFLGDHLIADFSPCYSGYKDFFNEEYVIKTSDGRNLRFNNFEEFLKEFFTLHDFIIWGMEESELSMYYVQVMVQLDSVRLVTPFTILSLLPFEGRFTTGWIRKEFTP